MKVKDSQGKWRAEPVGEGEWMLVEPREIEDVYHDFDIACELMWAGNNAKARKAFGKVLESAPTHIDAIHHLAMLLDESGSIGEAKRWWMKGVKIGRDTLPKKFKKGDKLEWGWLENRPFLRCQQGLGLALLADDKTDEALYIFEEIISYNPNDNQGIREMLVELYLEKCRYDDMIKLCKRYPDDMLVGTSYGYPLALFKKGQRKKADNELKKVIKDMPKVANELLKKKHRRPKTDMPEYISMGGWDQAYEYWEHFGGFWDEEALGRHFMDQGNKTAELKYNNYHDSNSVHRLSKPLPLFVPYHL